MTFKHSGKLGDLIYALPTIRALGGGELFVNTLTAHGLSTEEFLAAQRLIASQPYINGVTPWSGEAVDVDLDSFRNRLSSHTNIADAHLWQFGLPPVERDSQWLQVDASANRRGYVVISQSNRNQGPDHLWPTLLKTIGKRALFVGLPHEHASFVARFGPVAYEATDDLLGLAKVIARSALFVGNQSCAFSIAEGLKHDSVLLVYEHAPNCVFKRPNAWQIESERDLHLFDTALHHPARTSRRSSSVTFETKCWEGDWKRVLLSSWIEANISRHNIAFDERILIINNVQNEEAVLEQATFLKDRGVLSDIRLVSQHKNSALATFGVTEEALGRGYNYSIAELVGLTTCSTEFIVHYAGDVLLETGRSWVEDGIDLLSSETDVAVVNPVWNGQLEDARSESIYSKDHYAIGFGMSDQCYLARAEDFRGADLGSSHPASARYPEYGGDLFEKRVDSWMRTAGRLRAVDCRAVYRHPAYLREWVYKET